MKRRLVAAGLLLFALWPPLHFALVRRYDVDPWKLFGFAMYSVPGTMRTVRIVGIDEARLDRGEVSWVSPIARALLKSREGDTVELRTPAGVETIEVVRIEYGPM